MASTSSSAARVKSRAYAVKAAAELVQTAKGTMEEWCTREEQRVAELQAARVAVANAAPPLRFEAFVEYLQAVRRITRRPALLPEQIELVPKNEDLINTLIDIVLNPLTVQIGSRSGAVLAVSEDEMEVEGRAEYYVRQLDFANKQALSSFLDGCLKAKSHHAWLAARIKAEMKLLPEDVKLTLGYGGYTVASDAEGRLEEDQKGGMESFIHLILERYRGEVRIFTFPALEFGVAGDIASRSDPRASLFESLVVDSFGLVCANTAPPGQYIQLNLTPAQQARSEMVQSYVPEPNLFGDFDEPTITEKPIKDTGKGKAKEASGKIQEETADREKKPKKKSKALAEKDRNQASSKGKGKAKQTKDSPPVKRTLDPSVALPPAKKSKNS